MAYAASCTSTSSHTRTALVELYVSGNCRRCPEAQSWLRAIVSRHGKRGSVIGVVFAPHALRYASYDEELAARRQQARRDQRRARRGLPVPVLGPQVILQGEERTDWGMPAFDKVLVGLNAQPSPMVLTLEIEPGKAEAKAAEQDMRINVRVDLKHLQEKVALYVAAAALSTQPGSPALYQVMEWQGPIPVGSAGKLAVSLRFPRLDPPQAARIGAVAFVQGLSSKVVLQSIHRPPCGVPGAEGAPA